MGNQVKSPCLVERCPRFAHRLGRCEEHLREHERSIKRAGRQGSHLYGLKRWRALRRKVFFENPLCVECQAEGIDTIATEADHIVPIAEGGDVWNSANIQGLCTKHHARKTAREVNARRGVVA